MKIHEIKEWPATFQELIDGKRKIEIRFNDREYDVADILRIREWDPHASAYTNRECVRRVDTVHESPRLMSGYVVMEVSVADCPWELTQEGAKVVGEAKNLELVGAVGQLTQPAPDFFDSRKSLVDFPDDALFNNEPRSNPAAAINGR